MACSKNKKIQLASLTRFQPALADGPFSDLFKVAASRPAQITTEFKNSINSGLRVKGLCVNAMIKYTG